MCFIEYKESDFLKLAKKLSKEQKEEIIQSFSENITIDEISNKFKVSRLTIIRNLKKGLGEIKYKELIDRQKSIKQNKKTKSELDIKKDQEIPNSNFSNMPVEDRKFSITEFVELTPLNEEIENVERKDFSSLSIDDIELPNSAYMIVDKNIELEIKLLKEYAEWSFLPLEDLNRKTIKIYFDLKIAKAFCSKEQKVIKIPNTGVFKVVAPILISRGISRIVCPNKLIALN